MGKTYMADYQHPLYKVWTSMIARCHRKTKDNYARYGGRGIKVCERWRENFLAFVADVGERPVGTSLDRFPNNNGNYEPGNTRWATPKEQNRNSRKTVYIEYKGERLCLTDWALKLRIHENTFRNRVRVRGPSEAIRLSLLIGPHRNLGKVALRKSNARRRAFPADADKVFARLIGRDGASQ